MKSHILLACLVCMLFVSAVVLGEITMEDVEWDGEGDIWGYYASSEASAYCDGDKPLEISWASGGYKLQTSEAGEFDWWYYYEASAFAYACRNDTYTVSASASGYAYGSKGPEVFAHASVFISPPFPSKGVYDEPDSQSDEGTEELNAYDNISASHSVSASAGTYPGCSNWATATGDAGAVIDLSEN